MNNFRIIIILLFLFSIKAFAQSDTVITSLYGFEDHHDNTQLVFQTHYTHFTGINDTIHDDYYIFTPNNKSSKFIFESYEHSSSVNTPPYDIITKWVSGFHFFEDDPDSFLYSFNFLLRDVSCGFGYSGFDGYYAPGSLDRLFAYHDTVWVMYGGRIVFSSDRGKTWPNPLQLDSLNLATYNLLSVSPYNRQIFFGASGAGKLLKSYDQGITSTVVHDEDFWNVNSKIFYDADKKHVYGITHHYSHTDLLLSDNQGEVNSWTPILKYLSNNTFFAIDDSISGEIYYSDERIIYRSTDYGSSFEKFIELPGHCRITGLYKKPKSNLLYCSTQNLIYEISNGQLKIVKKFEVERNLDYYPITIGNKWVYKVHLANTDPAHPNPIDYNESITVINDSLHSDGHHYFVEEIKRIGDWNGIEYNLERIDTLNGKVMTGGFGNYGNFHVADFLAKPGDYFYTIFGEVYDVTESLENVYGEARRSLEFDISSLLVQYQKYISGIGLVYEFQTWDWGSTTKELKGCFINGNLYGDTLVVDVEEVLVNLPLQFELKQNYPNPFNPTTTISYSLPVSAFTTLKIYDLLGREVVTLVDEFKQAGQYNSQFSILNSQLSSGIYFYSLHVSPSRNSVPGFAETKKMMLLK